MTPPRDETQTLSTRDAFRRVFPGVMVAMFLAAADQTILATALPAIAAALGGLAELSWVVTAYLLAAAIAAPIYGRVGDYFGRRRMLLVALGIFAAASAFCAVATSLPMLIVGRALQGLGGGGLMTLAQAMIGEHISPRERGRYQGYFAGMFAVASTFGPVIGGYLTEHLTWRAVFVVNLPLALVAVLLALRLPPSPRMQDTKFRLDATGIVLFCLSTFALLWGLSSFGHGDALRASLQLAAVAGALIGLATLVWWELRVPMPIIPVRLLAQPLILRGDVVVMSFAGAFFPLVLYLPLYLQLGRGFGIGTSGLLLLPITFSMVTGAIWTGRRVSKFGTPWRYPIQGLSLTAACMVTLAILLPWLPVLAVVGLGMAAGLGVGHVMPACQVSIQSAAGREALGAAVGSISLSRSIGGALGTALVGAVLFAALGHDRDVYAAVDRAVNLGVAALSDAQRATLAAQLDTAFRAAFATVAVIAGGGALMATRVPRQAI